ncbi:hypothetical protein RSAG8_10335, partial [Rhizoctonia solani AG-8 WAC10335]
MSSNPPRGGGPVIRGSRRGRGNPNANRGTPRPSNSGGASRPPPAPKDICRDFQRGNCPRGDACRFSHTPVPGGSAAAPAPQQTFRDASSQPQNAENTNFPGLSNDKFSVAGLDHTPGQTHHFLKQYVEDSFRFNTTAQIYRFVNLLCNASSRNSSWTLEEGQNHLCELVRGNGILRLGDAIRFPAETNKPWSFQKGYIPILTYLSSDWVTKSRINTEVNALYGLVHNEFQVIRDTIITNMQRLMAARSFSEDPGSPLSGKQVFKVIFVTHSERVSWTLVTDATIKHPFLRDTAEQIADWFEEWVIALRSNPPFNDECTTYDEDKRQLIINNIRADKERVLRIVQRERVLLVNREERPTRQGATTEGLIATLQRNCDYDGPGERREKGPRHDNDKDDPFLPGNFAEAPHFYGPKSVERLVDVQFPRDKQVQSRVEYWEQVSKKRLMLGGLVALIWKDQSGTVDIYVGTVASTPRDLAEAAKKSKDRIALRVSFFDAEAELRIVQSLQNRRENGGIKVLIEAPVFYEGIRPFLEALKADPERLPFSHYLVHQNETELQQTIIAAPLYSRIPGFSFELKDLFPDSAGVQTLRMITTNRDSIANARTQLIRRSRLDPSQAEAVVDSLTREVSLIQGPPGTGKSYTGLELIRVLIKNQISPILLVAYTNHALDHMLKGILDADITKNIIRLGSRAAVDERLASFSLDEAEKISTKSRLDRNINSAYREMRAAETEMSGLMDKITTRHVPQEHMEECILSLYPYHYEELFSNTPSWISTLISNAAEEDEEWETVGKPEQDLSVINFWATGRDLQFLEPPKDDKSQTKKGQKSGGGTSNSNKFGALAEDNASKKGKGGLGAQHQAFLREFLSQHGTHQIPPIPHTIRSLEALKEDPMVWSMSLSERNTLYDTWYATASESIRESQIEDFENVRKKHAAAKKSFEEIKEQGKVNILRRSHIIGCTTTGAAKVVSLLSRLSSSGFPMSQIDVQRRMRPEVSVLIRKSLYPNLKDHELVTEYPDVRGMHKNVFFVSHANKETGGGEDSVSKHNAYEIDMIYELVLHLLRQGCYNKEGNIVVLAAYLGQIPKIRQKLRDVVTTIIDERDAELLVQHGIEDEETTTVQEVKVSKHVLIRTLDNFQGEEGEVIILSLVRNSGTPFDGHVSSLQYTGERSPIGFLRDEAQSTNRANVGLSRAKHGMYIFGNAPELARGSKMWATVLQELHQAGNIGTALPISCQRHPDYVKWIDQPGRLPIASPDGGCLLPCAEPLPCGHICPFKCNSDDPKHITTRCREPCLRLCPLSHPCDRECWECAKSIGDCRFPVRNVRLPCGDIHTVAPCYLARMPEKIKCIAQIEKQLPFCEHKARMPCRFTCCSKPCAAKCGACQKLSSPPDAGRPQIGRIARTQHPKHLCGRVLRCGHTCKDECKEGHACSGTCKEKCRQVCPHGGCRQPCSTPCKPCVQPCAWNCAHIQCPSACGMTCTRLPCDKKCPNVLRCGHPCPSVCGEPCAKQTCRFCANDNTLESIVDLVMHTSLRDLEDDGTLDSMTITLPCGHVFTVETLDGITHLGDFYEKDVDGRWVKAVIPDDTGEIRTRPVCPSCRGNIDSLRYGRVCKNSNLAILQHNIAHNIASSLSRRLAKTEEKLATVRAGLEKSVVDAVKACKPDGPDQPITAAARRDMEDNRDITLAREADRPTPAEVIDNIAGFHAFPESYAKTWQGGIKAALDAYRNARQIACERDPAVQAYEASLSQLYRGELGRFGVDFSLGTPRDVEQQALRLARMQIGQLPPRASLRFVVEAFWITINILMQLGVATSKASDEVRGRNPNATEHQQWEQLAEFILARAVKDAETVYELAIKSESWNKAIKCLIFVLQTRYELAAHQCRVAIGKGAPLSSDAKTELVDMCRRGIQYIKDLQTSVPQEYSRRWAPAERQNKLTWVNANFVQPANVILESWETMKRSAKGGNWYQEVTNAERAAIMQAMMQGAGHDRLYHTGHFYQCPNGHPYVIGECGGAMEESACPECGARIGGSSHRALAGNTHATEFVDLARQGGVEDAGWAWGPRGR